ncbi:MAG TPA: hypothetical protein VFE50_09920 [Cyclobacteriaceae bacterium]|nr:hypothetical protein [Cyclobacteriaceae bacterium]
MKYLPLFIGVIILSCNAPTKETPKEQTMIKDDKPCKMIPFFQLDQDTVTTGEMVTGIIGVITSDVDDTKLAEALKSLEYQIDTVNVQGRSFPADSLYFSSGRINDSTFRFAFKSGANQNQSILKKKEFSAFVKLSLPGDTKSEPMGCEFTNKFSYYVKGRPK